MIAYYSKKCNLFSIFDVGTLLSRSAWRNPVCDLTSVWIWILFYPELSFTASATLTAYGGEYQPVFRRIVNFSPILSRSTAGTLIEFNWIPVLWVFTIVVYSNRPNSQEIHLKIINSTFVCEKPWFYTQSNFLQ